MPGRWPAHLRSLRVSVARAPRVSARSVLVMVLVAVTGCPGDDDAESPPDEPVDATTAPDAEPDHVDLAGLEAAGIQATAVDPSLAPGQQLAIGGDGGVVAVSDVLVSNAYDDDNELRLVRSTDLGASWEPLELPGAPTEHGGLLYDAGAAAIVARTDLDSLHGYFWASSDGVTWRGGDPVDLGADFQGLDDVAGQLPDGRLAITVFRWTAANPPGAPTDNDLVVASDGGASWRHIGCPPEARSTTSGIACVPLQDAGRGLWLRLQEASRDGGHTWHTATLDPDPGAVTFPAIDTAVPVEGNGWLGSASVILPSHNPAFLGYLVHSTDGTSWEPILSDPCANTDIDYSASSVSRPVQSGDQWLVTYTCTSDTVPQRSELYLLDPDGTHPRLVAEAQPETTFGTPLAAGSTVIVPEIHGEPGPEHDITLLQLRRT
jgi:hypothetical protein